MATVKVNLKKKKLHTELLFCALGSSSPDQNEGIFFSVLDQWYLHAFLIHVVFLWTKYYVRS